MERENMEALDRFIKQWQKQESLLALGSAIWQANDSLWHDLALLPFDKVVTIGETGRLPPAWPRAGRQLLPWRPGAAVPMTRRDIPWLALPDQSPDVNSWGAMQFRLWLTTHLVFFVGCDLDEAIIKACYFHFDQEAMANHARSHRPGGWAVLAVPPLQQAYWEQRGIHLAIGNPADWVIRLSQRWQGQTVVQEAPGQSLPEGTQPYRFLLAYQEEDADCFFGRETAIRDLGELTLAERLVVCFGPSGAGKSSLLQAGVMPLLRRQGYLPLYCRPAGSPLQTARQAVLNQLATRPTGEEDLASLLARLTVETGGPVVLLLDQFEELFTLSGLEIAQKMAAELASCLRRPELAVHIVLSLREDFLANLDELKAYLPQIFTHRFRVRPLHVSEAKAAIKRPAQLCGLAYEPALTARLLADLEQDKEVISPADLQIVCGTLYEAVRQREGKLFRLADYQALGEMVEILGGYLERVVTAETEPAQVRAVLKTLVTAQGTKVALPVTEISRLADLPFGAAQAILGRLDQPHRLVRPLLREQATWYELTHEIVGPRILGWLASQEERLALTLHDLLRAEQASWRQIGVIPGPGQVQFVYEQRQNPHLRLSQPDLELLLRGALAHGIEPTYWLEQAAAAGVVGEDLLRESLESPVAAVRQRAAELLPPRLAVGILASALNSPEPERRIQAATTLAEVGDSRAWSALRRRRHDPIEGVRMAVWDGLNAINSTSAVRLWRGDQLMPLLAAGTIVYWLIYGSHRELLATPGALLTAGGIWLAALLILLALGRRWPLAGEIVVAAQDEETAPQRGRLWRLLSGGIWLGLFWLLVTIWGWWGGLALWLVLVWGMHGRLSLAWAALLPFLPGFGLLPVVPLTVAGVTAVMGTTLSLLCLFVPRWGQYGEGRAEALAVLAGGLGGLSGAWLALAVGLETGSLTAGLLLGSVMAVGRQHARRTVAMSGGSDLGPVVADIGRALWEVLDDFSPQLKPLLEGTLGSVWAVLLLRWSAELAGGGAVAWSVGGGLWLGLGLGLGLAWGRRWLWRLLPLVGGAVGGWLALGAGGAVLGGCLGVGLAVGEWLAARGAADVHNNGDKGVFITP